MQLLELLKQAEEWDNEEATIYVVEPWSYSAESIIVSPAPDTIEPIEYNGQQYQYFLETSIARDFIEDYAASDEGRNTSAKQRCERLIYYAHHDT
jgi:hypothetical protein